MTVLCWCPLTHSFIHSRSRRLAYDDDNDVCAVDTITCTTVNHRHYCLSLCRRCTQHAAIVNCVSFTRLPVITVTIISSSSCGRSLSPAPANQRSVGMATVPNSAADWSRASHWLTSMTSNARGAINAAGKSRQISLGCSNLSFIARINGTAQWTGRHLCLSSNIRSTISNNSSSSSKYSMSNVCMYISILLRHRHQPIQPQSRQVSLVTNQISRPIFAHTFIHKQLPPGALPPHAVQYSIISNFISSVVGAAC